MAVSSVTRTKVTNLAKNQSDLMNTQNAPKPSFDK